MLHNILVCAHIQVEDLCDALQATAVENLQLLADQCPHVVTPRHIARTVIQRYLAMLHAIQQGRRIIIWQAQDTTPEGHPLDAEKQSIVNEAVPNKTQGLNSFFMFFEVRYSTAPVHCPQHTHP